MLKIVKYIAMLLMAVSCHTAKQKTFLFVGTFTEGIPSSGIYVYTFDQDNGKLHLVYTEKNIINPSFLSLAPDGKYLYACTESQLDKNGSVSAFKIDTVTGKLSFINKQSSGGRNPAHVAVAPHGDFLVTCNYTDPGVGVFKRCNDGGIHPYSQLFQFKDSSIIKGRQDEAHLHSANFSPDGRYVFAQDLGSDKIRAFTADLHAENILTPVDHLQIETKPGSGPRHFTFHPNGKYAYGIAELGGLVLAYRYDEGQLNFITSYLSYSKEQDIYGAADIHISPDGKFLYASNRGPEENTISIFAIDTASGRLTLVGHEPTYGDHPRNFVIDPSGNFLLVANLFSNTIIVFRRDSKTGLLKKQEQEITVSNPSSLRMWNYAY